jgi:plastocyanin
VTDAAEKRAFKSPPLDTGDAFSFVFSTPGTYPYFCALHPHMQGTVVVK